MLQEPFAGVREPRVSGPLEGEACFQALLESTSEIVFLVDAGGTVRYATPSLARVLGHDAGAQAGRSVFELVHPDDAPHLILAFTGLVRGAPFSVQERRFRHTDGSWRLLELEASNLLGRPPLSGLVLTARDVTERRRAETARRQLTAILDGTPDFVVTADPHGRILYVNAAAQERLGVALADAARYNLPDFYPSWATARLLGEAIPTAIREGVWRGDLALLLPRAGEVPVSQVVLAHRGEGGALQFLSLTARDISESKRAEAALRDSEERFRQVAENIEEVFWLVSCDDWRVLFVSPAYEQVWGRRCADLLADPGWLLRDVHEDDRAEQGHGFEQFFANPEREYRIVRPGGEVRWIRSRFFPVRNAEGAVYRVAAISEDITDRRRKDEHLRRLAMHDPLTQLPNRTALIHRLLRALERAEHQPQASFAVVFVDLDRFKLVNDSLGHMRGDELLVAIGRRLESCVRPEDMVARLGGDEFAVLLHHTPSAADAARVAERILHSFSESFTIGGHEVFAGASMGIVPSAGYAHPEDLLRDADIAMYRAKVGGRGTYRVFDSAMHADVVARLKLETDLRLAVDRQEFELYFQPIINLSTGSVAGLEALLRWRHPERGQVLPAGFIGVAEEIGVIVPLGWWVLREACEQMARWTREFPQAGQLSMSVNLSAKQFSQHDVPGRLRRILDETGVDPRRLKLEITESVLIEHSGAVRATLDEIRGWGVELHIDDFGTGYSSLSYLDRFPIDVVKIDRSLVARIGPAGEGGEIVHTVISLAQNLGMTVVAEGVETAAQLRQLRKLGCDSAQGFLFSRPVSAGGTQELLRTNPRW
jgi:diguanylate cyclase (GGDEF)-like protein/PAS domain S-box-containing protein